MSEVDQFLREMLNEYNIFTNLIIAYHQFKFKSENDRYDFKQLIIFIGKELRNINYKVVNSSIIDNPFFITGCGCSGTSLCSKLLSNHSNIYFIPFETRVFCLGLDKNILLTIFQLFSYICIKMGKKLWGEKTPAHVHHINDMFEVLPNANVIIVTRHGKAVSSSLKYFYNSTLQFGLERWIKDNLAWLNNIHNEKCLVIKYEDIVRNSLTVFQILCASLNIEFENLSNTQYNTTHIDWSKPEHLTSSEDRIKLRLWQINQLIYDNIDESMTKMNDDDILLFDNFVYDNYTANIVLKRLNYV